MMPPTFPPAKAPVPAPGLPPAMAPAPVPGFAPVPAPSLTPAMAPVPAPMMPPTFPPALAPAPGPGKPLGSKPIIKPGMPGGSLPVVLGSPGTPPPPASVTGTPGAPPPPAGVMASTPPPPDAGTSGTPPPPAGVMAGTPPPPATGTPGTPPPPAGMTADTPPPPATGTPGTPPTPAGMTADTPPPPATGTPGTPPPPAGMTAGTPPPPAGGTPGTPPPVGGPLAPVKLVDDTFVNANTGDVVELHGMSWFGFNNGQTMVDGLYAGNTYQVADFKTIVFRQQQLGFNAVRLPFTFSDLNLPPKSWTMPCTDDTASLKADLEDPDAPYNGIDYSAKKFPAFKPLGNGMCNSDLPNDSTLNRYLFVIQHYVSQGFYVLVDYHAYPGDTTVASGALVSDWKTLWTAITALPTFASELAGRVFLDLINEPDGINVRWEAANGNPALADLYIDTMTALDAIDKRAIYFIEGTGQSGFVTAWGDGFVTNKGVISQNGLSDPTAFLDRLSTMPFLNRVVLSPHMYGDSVTGGPASSKEGSDLYNRLSQSTGVLAKFGYTPSGGGTAHRFPIAIGEFGTKFTSGDDMAWIHDFSQWKNNIGAANDGLHDNVNSYFFWSWNANSGDTGGLVDDSWLTVQWPKIDFLTVSPNSQTATNSAAPGGWGLTPWYLS
ncbi:g4812 [Coccomyxa viridis]|uniref:G4812 protein n=1 Tax=Coccomyxa viridis TaxID=1274662 RepID=A0ABP1FY30_9CHLO